MSYDFVNVTEQPRDWLPPAQLIYGGLNLDKELHDFYRTINIFGRDPLGPRIQLTERTGGPGSWIDSIEYPERTITVQGLFNIDRKDLAIRLDSYFGREIKTLKFSDMPDWNFDGILSDVELPYEHSDTFFADLVFLCPNPRMYSDVKTLETDDGSLYFPTTALGDIEIQRFEVMIEQAHTQLWIDKAHRGTGRIESDIVLSDLILAVGDKVVFDFKNDTITHHTQGWERSILSNLDLTRDFEGFKYATRDSFLTLTRAVDHQKRMKVEYIEVVF